MAAPTKPQTTAIVPWKERLAAGALKAKEAERNALGTSNFIKTAGGIMMYNGAKVTDNKLPCVIVGALWHNAFYEGGFDPASPASPICYAYSVDGEGMAPHKDSPAPQHENCAECPHNQFGTADKGKGKACKNGRRIGLVGASDLVSIDTAVPAQINCPPGSIKAWVAYVRAIADNYGVEPLGVVTEISLENAASGGFNMNFNLTNTEEFLEGTIDDGAVIEGLYKIADAIVLDTPYPVFEEPVKLARPQRPVIQRPMIQRPTPVPVRPVAPVPQRPTPVPVPQRPAPVPVRPVAQPPAQPISLPAAPVAAAPKPPARKF